MCAMSSNFVDETLSIREFMKYGVTVYILCFEYFENTAIYETFDSRFSLSAFKFNPLV